MVNFVQPSYSKMVQNAEVGPLQGGGYHPVKLLTNQAYVHCRYYPVAGAQHEAIWVEGVGGD